jgi:hypothetical protein
VGRLYLTMGKRRESTPASTLFKFFFFSPFALLLKYLRIKIVFKAEKRKTHRIFSDYF